MESFLKIVAQKIIEEHPNNLDRVIVVFNNRRSGLFLKKQFKNITETATFIPKIIGIDDLVLQLGELQIIPNEFLLFELFDIHRNLEGEERKFETFEEFISFGDMMLSDFSEIDLYCVNAQDLFGNLHDLKAIGEWNISGEKLSPFQEKYLKFYKSLYIYYTQLHERLQKKNMAYSGMAYRNAAEHIDSMIDKIDCDDIYFVGFNALSKCEETIIKKFKAFRKGHIITDGDTYYYNDIQQEAGNFLRKHSDVFGNQYKEHFNQPKKITIVSCPENILQTKYAGKCLNTWIQEQTELEQTAIVLSDENLLLPMLNSLPKEILSANITMGFPFTNSEAHSLMLKLFSLYNRSRNNRFYYQDIIDILSDYLISNTHGISNLRSIITQYLAKETIIYLNLNTLQKIATELEIDISNIQYLFTITQPDPDRFLQFAQKLTILLYETNAAQSNQKEKEALGNLLDTINYFIKLQETYHFITDLNTLQKIYTRFAQHRTISFYGEPLSGLQILGVLETRNLDFNKIIMLSVNEGIIPSGRGNNTLIPLQLKSNFGIPTYNEKDAVYAYHFYRFLQRAESIYLVYNTETDGFGKGESSRFIMQIRNELAKKYPNIEITEEVLSVNNIEIPIPQQSIGIKTQDVMNQLEKIAQGIGFSPSALNIYRSCPLKFYYEKILKINESENVNEDIENAELGTYIHSILQDIYSIDSDHNIHIETLEHALANINNLLESKFKELYENGLPQEGKNHLMKSVAKVQLERFLKKEIKLLKEGYNIQIKLLEEQLHQPISININGAIKQVNIQGTADRIDYIYKNNDTNRTLRIVDYKTGKVTPKDLKPTPKDHSAPDKLFQVMTYLWLYCKQHEHIGTLQSGIYPLQNLKEGFIPGEWNNHVEITEEDINDFVEQELVSIITELMDPNSNFKPCENSKSCTYCTMASICHKS